MSLCGATADPSRFVGLGSEAHWSGSVQVVASRRPAQRESRLPIGFVGKLLGHAIGAADLEVVNAVGDKKKICSFLGITSLPVCMRQSKAKRTWSVGPVIWREV